MAGSMERRSITFTTDFGTDSPYVAQMKASVLAIVPAAHLVDITHSIRAQNVVEGAIVVADSAFYFPSGTIHVAVVDPGVGTDRGIIAALVAGHWFIAPDNGLLTGILEKRNATDLRAVANRALWRDDVSTTFHGRDIMAPVAAHLMAGVPAEEIGPLREDFVNIPWPMPSIKGNALAGEIIYVDSFGNLITNIHRSDLDAFAVDQVLVNCGKLSIDGITRTYGDCETGSFVALIGSSGRLEIAATQGNASKLTGLGPGESVIVTRP